LPLLKFQPSYDLTTLSLVKLQKYWTEFWVDSSRLRLLRNGLKRWHQFRMRRVESSL